MILGINDIPKLYDPRYQKIFKNVSVKEEEMYKSFVNVVTGVTDLITYETGITGLSEASYDNGENSAVTSDRILAGYDQSYTQERVWKAVEFTHLVWKFGITKRQLEAVATDVKQTIVRKRERLCIERVANGFATSYTHTDSSGSRTITTTGGDGVAFFSAAHTREDGGSNWSNIITDASAVVNVPLDYAGLRALRRTEADMVDGRGNPMMVSSDTIVIVKGSRNAEWIHRYNATVKSGKLPDSADNDVSAYTTFKVIELPPQYFGSNVDYWFAFDSSYINDEHGFQLLESLPITSDPMYADPYTDKVMMKAKTYFALGHRDARGWFGSKSTSAS